MVASTQAETFIQETIWFQWRSGASHTTDAVRPRCDRRPAPSVENPARCGDYRNISTHDHSTISLVPQIIVESYSEQPFFESTQIGKVGRPGPTLPPRRPRCLRRRRRVPADGPGHVPGSGPPARLSSHSPTTPRPTLDGCPSTSLPELGRPPLLRPATACRTDCKARPATYRAPGGS